MSSRARTSSKGVATCAYLATAKLQSAERVCDVLQGVHNAVRVVVGGVHTPLDRAWRQFAHSRTAFEHRD